MSTELCGRELLVGREGIYAQWLSMFSSTHSTNNDRLLSGQHPRERSPNTTILFFRWHMTLYIATSTLDSRSIFSPSLPNPTSTSTQLSWQNEDIVDLTLENSKDTSMIESKGGCQRKRGIEKEISQISHQPPRQGQAHLPFPISPCQEPKPILPGWDYLAPEPNPIGAS